MGGVRALGRLAFGGPTQATGDRGVHDPGAWRGVLILSAASVGFCWHSFVVCKICLRSRGGSHSRVLYGLAMTTEGIVGTRFTNDLSLTASIKCV